MVGEYGLLWCLFHSVLALLSLEDIVIKDAVGHLSTTECVTSLIALLKQALS